MQLKKHKYQLKSMGQLPHCTNPYKQQEAGKLLTCENAKMHYRELTCAHTVASSQIPNIKIPRIALAFKCGWVLCVVRDNALSISTNLR